MKAQADMMWDNMEEEVKQAYGRKHFDKKVGRDVWDWEVWEIERDYIYVYNILKI